jgi:hypothetical protein
MSFSRWSSRRMYQAGFGEHARPYQRLQSGFDSKIDATSEQLTKFTQPCRYFDTSSHTPERSWNKPLSLTEGICPTIVEGSGTSNAQHVA